MKFNTIKEATQEWVKELNAIPMNVVDKLLNNDFDELNEVTIFHEDEEEEYRDYLPMWGTMWAFGDNIDNEWLEDHIEDMSKCGFRIYEQEDYGYIFGIDGAGYDFYEEHWIPLYKVRGLHWHKEGENE